MLQKTIYAYILFGRTLVWLSLFCPSDYRYSHIYVTSHYVVQWILGSNWSHEFAMLTNRKLLWKSCASYITTLLTYLDNGPLLPKKKKITKIWTMGHCCPLNVMKIWSVDQFCPQNLTKIWIMENFCLQNFISIACKISIFINKMLSKCGQWTINVTTGIRPICRMVSVSSF